MNKIPSNKVLRRMPKRHAITNCKSRIITVGDMPIGLHFYTKDREWYMVEYDAKKRFFYGYTLDRKNSEKSDFEETSLDDLIEYHDSNGSDIVWDENWTVKKLFDMEDVWRSLGIRYRSQTILGSDDDRHREPIYKRIFSLDFFHHKV